MSRVRLSVRWRRNWKLVAGLVVGLVALVALFGSTRLAATVASRGAGAADAVALDVPARRPLFDPAVLHEIEVRYAAADYERMIARLKDENVKDFVEADVAIDGTELPSTGIRLKGNSTLFGIRGFPGGNGGFGGREGFRRPPAVGPPEGGDPVLGGGGGRPEGLPGLGGGRGGFGISSATEDEPERLPWLVELDTFVPGRRYDGLETFAIRAGGAVTPTTALNEALGYRLVDLAGEPAARISFAMLAVAGRAPTLRLLVEDPDRPFAERELTGDGVLYKSLSTSSFTYKGEDPVAYADDFAQVTRKREQDLQPLIDLVHWVETASDAEFAAGLADRVDVESLARYLALHNLLLDFDDMAGPGQNSYLWYDLDSRLFTVVTWDLNLAFSGVPTRGPLEEGGFGPGGFGPRGGHRLKERALADPAFQARYLRAYHDLYQRLFESGVALRELDRLATVAARGGGETARREASALRAVVVERTEALATALG